MLQKQQRIQQISIHALREEGDTRLMRYCCSVLKISIHALREEGDCKPSINQIPALSISIHALREEGDRSPVSFLQPHPYFNPRPPRGGRHKHQSKLRWCVKFQSTPSARRATCCAV